MPSSEPSSESSGFPRKPSPTDELVLAAMRVEDFPDSVPGSRIRICGSCGEDVWVSPASMQMMQESIAPKIRCLQCLDLG